ncbi:ParB N-terminal domain-containing protein [Phototrophicus methaneseepsis]|uniref:ParB N-terminal domain-containing protein n=1 Tax=Phototrophicus methaneseepsis TaxID=2710758 RepID=A0A7S8IEG9_9CHLR|nr:ParB N-terminal domain-containing protein [Phototrophicus methaneseepsis]QPC83655.1 ParB N-terminal domain-containing protein [Phototrophicus methaneseepsis]
MARKKREINTSLLDNVTADMLGGGDMAFFQDEGLKVEYILLELVRPDPLQPRRVLPDRIYQAFHAGQVTPSQAMRELIQIAQLAARQQGRPFSNVLDLLGNPEEDNSEELPPLSPEEQLVHDLVNLAVTIRDDGQVNPLTVVDVSQGITRQYRIETGERRYWATWILRDFISGYESDGMIPCIVIPNESASAFRQAKENTARSGLSAIAMARQAALLLLYVHGYPMPEGPVPPDFYRQALELRIPKGQAETMHSSLGGVTKQRFNQYKDLLKLSDEAMELADRNNLDEYILRPVLQLPPETHMEMIQHIIQFGLTGRQVHDIVKHGMDDDTVDLTREISPHIRGFVRSMQKMSEDDEGDFIQRLLEQENSVSMACVRLESTISFLTRIQNQLQENR